MHAPLTQHARARMQQRGIPRELIELVLDYGRSVHDHHGAVLYFLDKADMRRAERELGARLPRRRGDGPRTVYVVESTDGAILTVGHRTKRFRRC